MVGSIITDKVGGNFKLELAPREIGGLKPDMMPTNLHGDLAKFDMR